MSCKETEILLDDYVDDELAGPERGAVETHLAACEDCRRALDELRGLQRAVGALPSGLAPARDLLPAVREAALSGQRRGPALRWIAAVAAAVLLAAVAWLGSRGPAEGPRRVADAGSAADAPLAASLALSEFEAAEIEYERAAQRLLEVLDARQADLAPETREIVLENLQIIDGAIAKARAALEADPTDARNGRALNALHRQKVELLWRLSRVSS